MSCCSARPASGRPTWRWHSGSRCEDGIRNNDSDLYPQGEWHDNRVKKDGDIYSAFLGMSTSASRARNQLYPRVGFIVTNLRLGAKKVIAFYNGPVRRSGGTRKGSRRSSGRGSRARPSEP